jgi:hypothetical protein
MVEHGRFAFGTWLGERTGMWLGLPEPAMRLVDRCKGDGERSRELDSGSKSFASALCPLAGESAR